MISFPLRLRQTFLLDYYRKIHCTFKIYEGERKIATKNNFLGNLFFDGLTPGAAGDVKVLLTLSIDRNGVSNRFI